MAEIRLPHEPGPGVGVGVQGHRFDPRPALRVEFTDGVDEPHRGLSPVDDRDPAERRTRRRSHPSRGRGFRCHGHKGLPHLWARWGPERDARSFPNSRQLDVVSARTCAGYRRSPRLPPACRRLGTPNRDSPMAVLAVPVAVLAVPVAELATAVDESVLPIAVLAVGGERGHSRTAAMTTGTANTVTAVANTVTGVANTQTAGPTSRQAGANPLNSPSQVRWPMVLVHRAAGEATATTDHGRGSRPIRLWRAAVAKTTNSEGSAHDRRSHTRAIS